MSVHTIVKHVNKKLEEYVYRRLHLYLHGYLTYYLLQVLALYDHSYLTQ